MNSPVRKALIVGGGIAGLTAAIALKRKGIDAELLEINPAWSVYGVGIIQPSNMLRAMDQLGLLAACLREGHRADGWHFCNTEGQVLASVAGHSVAGPDVPPTNGIRRPALHKILTEAVLAQGTPVRLGVTLAGWRETADGIVAQLSDGSEARYDLIIGADGIRSKVRSMLLPTLPPPRFTGQGGWRYNLPRPRDMHWCSMFHGHHSKAGLVPLSQELMYLFLLTAEADKTRFTDDELPARLRERLAEYGGPIGELRALLVDPKEVVYRPLEVISVPLPWHRGRLVLIGDAVHAGTPHLAQGATMAAEDALVLADLLAQAGDLEDTLRRFGQRRWPRTQLVYETGLRLGELEMAEWAGHPVPPGEHSNVFAQASQQLMQPA